MWKNRRFQAFIAFLLSVITLALWYKFIHKRPISTLRLKQNLEKQANFKRPISWSTLTHQDESKSINKNTYVSTHTLMQEIENTMNNLKVAKINAINKAIKQAEELIYREPYRYSAYKAKLVLLLTKEAKYFTKIDDEEVRRLLDKMSQFDVVTDKTLKKEALLIARTNSKLDDLFFQLDSLEEDINKIDNDLFLLSYENEEANQLLNLKNNLEINLNQILVQIQLLEQKLSDGVLESEDFVNEDLIEVVFKRSLAKKQYAEAIEEAQVYLDHYPNSENGYFYLVRALELNGNSEEAIEVLQNVKLNQEKINRLEKRLEQAESTNPQDYWRELRF